MASVERARPTDKPLDTVKCGPCVNSGLVKEASAYCQQCEEHMCVVCASMHKGFKISRNHSIISGSDLLLTEQTGVKKNSLSYCAEHGDEAIEWLCEEEDVMCCDTCKCIKHRRCKITHVSDKTALEHAQSLADGMKALVSLNSRIKQLKSVRQDSAKQLEDVAYSCELAVKQFKSTIIKTVESLANELLSEINKVVTTETLIIQDHVFTCDSLIPQVEDALTTAENAKTTADNVTCVIAAHKLAEALKTLVPTVSDLEKEVHDVQIKFKPSGKLAEIFTGTDQLGVLEIDRTEAVGVHVPETTSDCVSPVSVRTSWSDMNAVSSTEINVQSDGVAGLAVMPHDRIVLADYSNRKCVLLDRDFTILSTLTLEGRPRDVAAYGDNAAVVTMPNNKQLQYIHVDTTLRAGHTIRTGLQCCGVAVYGGEIYLAVIDSQYGDHVQVHDKGWNVTRRIRMTNPNIYGNIRLSSIHILVGTGGNLYISDYITDHIMCYTCDGDVVYDVKHEGVSGPCGMSVDEEGNLIVCCYESNTIHVLGKDGAHHKVFLSSADGVVRPQSMSYRRSDHTIIVSMENNPSCRAYKLK